MSINSTKDKNKNIYVNKILKESLGKTQPENERNENLPNFHSNIRNILSNEEKREKAIKYIVDMRKTLILIVLKFHLNILKNCYY